MLLLRPSLLSFFERRFAADAAEDLAQLSLLRIGGALGRIDPERADVYVSTVARNLLRTTYRRNARELRRDGQIDPADLVSNDQSSDARVEYADLVRAVHGECMRLGPTLRAVAIGVLRGDSAGDIAKDLGVSPITVRTRLMRVRAALRAELSPFLDGETGRHRRA